REEYRALIDAQDLTTEAGRALWAELVGMAGVMDQILPAVSGLTAELETLLGAVSTSLDATINAVTESQKAAATAAGNWYKAADSIAEFIRTMRSTSGALVSPTQATAFSQAQYQTRLASALAGDLDAVNGLTGVAQTYLDAVGATAGSATELALAQARVLSDLGTVQGASQIEGARWDVIQGLYQDQVDLMQEVADTLAAGNALSEAQIATLTSQLGSLDDAIAAAAAINYASLQKQIDLSITAVEDAQIPEYLKALLRNADTGITSYVDFVTRSDLTPDLKWLALTGASEMVKTVTYAAENDLGADLTRLAVDTVSTLRKTVHLLAGAGLDA
ncbi:tail tape measure protein, partial [Sinirhodobacter hankyongi]